LDEHVTARSTEVLEEPCDLRWVHGSGQPPLDVLPAVLDRFTCRHTGCAPTTDDAGERAAGRVLSSCASCARFIAKSDRDHPNPVKQRETRFEEREAVPTGRDEQGGGQ